MSKQPEALRLADVLESTMIIVDGADDAVGELRRLYVVNQELLAVLKLALPHINPKAIDRQRVQDNPVDECYVNTIVRKVIEKAEAV